MAAANFNTDFSWDNCSNISHCPRNGDIVITITCSSVVEIYFWQEVTDRPLLTTYHGAWILSISDMRTTYFGGAEAENEEIVWPLGFRVLFAYQYWWDLDAWLFAMGLRSWFLFRCSLGLDVLARENRLVTTSTLYFIRRIWRPSPISWRWNGGKWQ